MWMKSGFQEALSPVDLQNSRTEEENGIVESLDYSDLSTNDDKIINENPEHVDLGPENDIMDINRPATHVDMMQSSNNGEASVTCRQGRLCPFDECSNSDPYPRLDKHLKQFHRIDASDEAYRQLIKVKKCRNVVSKFAHEATSKYATYLMTVGGGNVGTCTASKLRLKVNQIITGMTANCYADMWDEGKIQVLRSWMVEYCKRNSPSSTITYLADLIRFVKYLAAHKLIPNRECLAIRRKLNTWQKSFRKLNRGMEHSFEKALSPADLQTFKAGSACSEMKSISAAIENKKLNIKLVDYPRQHAVFRNTIMLLAMLKNACRSCVLSNLQLTEFERAEKVEVDLQPHYVVYVSDHKSVEMHGPATLLLEEDLYQKFSQYHTEFRYNIQNRTAQESTNFFVTFSGKGVTSSDVSHGLQAVWKMANLTSKIGYSQIGKSVTTAEIANIPHAKDAVANQLCYKLSTAEGSYKLHIRSKESVQASKIIDSALSGQFASQTVQIEASTSGTQSLPSDMLVEAGSGRATYTPAERRALFDLFSKFTSKGVVPSARDIRIVLHSNEDVFGDWNERKLHLPTIKRCLQNFKNKFVKN